MMNIKSIYITTGISFLCGLYSIYNLLEYLRLLNNDRMKEINILQNQVDETNKKYIDLQNKNAELELKYNKLLFNYEQINQEIEILNFKIVELQENKKLNIKIPIENYLDNDNFKNSNSIICDELCDLNDSIPRIKMFTTIPHNYDDIDNEFIDCLTSEYDCQGPNELLKDDSNTKYMSSSNNSEFSKNRTRSRSLPISTNALEVNWTTLTKKFLFG